MYLTFI